MGTSSQRTALLAGSAIALALSVTLCFVPLFDLVGYELGLAVAPLAAVVSIQLGLTAVESVFAAWGRTILRTYLVLLVPLVVLGANALRVKNCNIGIGLVWYAVLPGATAIVGAAFGVAVGAVWPRARGPVASTLVALAIPLVAAAWSLYRLYAAPPIFVFDSLFGYFAGTVYDERVTVPTALLCARAYHLALALAAVTLAARTRVAVLFVGLALAGYLLGPRLGYREDAASIARALGASRTTKHFVLHYAADGPFAKEMDDMAREAEFRWSELADALHLEPSVTVHAYLFSSAADKQRLMGAGHTYIAKPWRRELYLNWEPFPEPVFGHELAHVFGADLGDWLLGLPRAGVRLDVGLTEGFAEALAWQGGPLTPDESAAVLERLHRLPSLDVVMSSGFWSLPAQQAYAVAASFCGMLIERFGVEKLVALYRSAGVRDAYPAIFGESFEQLDDEWLARIRGVELAPGVMERERDRILRPSIFHRPCARELARKLDLARQLSGRGDHPGAETLLETVCSDEPDDPGHLEDLLAEKVRAKDVEGAREVARRVLAHPKISASQRAATYAVLADLDVGEEKWRAGANDYARAESQPSDEAQGRLYTVKRVIAARLAEGHDAPPLEPAIEDVMRTLVHGSGDATVDFDRLTTPAKLAPDDPLLVYLAARQLSNKGSFPEAEERLARALHGGLPDERFDREAHRLFAEIAFRRHDYALADARYSELAKTGPAAFRLDAAQWAARARFDASHP